ncbi:hypothetical protein HMN09_00568800 [Mycena chlorophos]|uniref:Transcription factor domain-containing protein n=1 Tax=Mycena chlorophos TaxID=658473 RepID=A0A8H6TCI7_MYCCL|nr:hypothetical protein HMN09_00568800 [Mycena chlorophos]
MSATPDGEKKPRQRRPATSYLHKACENCRRGFDRVATVVAQLVALASYALPGARFLANTRTPRQMMISANSTQRKSFFFNIPAGLSVITDSPSSPMSAPHAHVSASGFASPAEYVFDAGRADGAIASTSRGSDVGGDRNEIEVFLMRFSDSPLFFLDPDSLRAATSGPDLPPANQTSPILLDVIRLWRRRISYPNAGRSDIDYARAVFARKSGSLQNIAPGNHPPEPRLVMEDIQAEVLRSYYCLDVGMPEEGRHHCERAVALALYAGIVGPPPIHTRYMGPQMGSMLVHSSEAREAFWALLFLSNMWVPVAGLPSSIESNIENFLNAWPESDTADPFSTICITLRTVEPGSWHKRPPSRLLVESVTLFERIVSFCEREKASGIPDPKYFAFMRQRLEETRARHGALPPASSFAGPSVQMLFLGRCLIHLALIRLHTSLNRGELEEDSRRTAAAAVMQITQDVVRASSFEWTYAEPAFGPIISMVCDIYASNADRAARADIQNLLALLSRLSQLSPTIENSYLATYMALPTWAIAEAC